MLPYKSTFTVTGTAETQFGTPLVSSPVKLAVASTGATASGNNGVLVTGMTDATGKFSLSYTDATATAAQVGTKVDTVTVSILNLPPNTTGSTLSTVTVNWSASTVSLTGTTFGGVASTAITGFATVPYDGTVDELTVLGGAAVSPGDMIAVTTTASVPGVPVTFTAKGASWSLSSSTRYNASSVDADSVTVTSAVGTGRATAYLFATKTGVYDVSVSAPTATPVTAKVEFKSAGQAARNIALLDEAGKPLTSLEIAPGTSKNVIVEVTDVFGNKLPKGSVLDTGAYVIAGTLSQFGTTLTSYTGLYSNAIGEGGRFTVPVSLSSTFTGTASLTFEGIPMAVTNAFNNQFGAARNQATAYGDDSTVNALLNFPASNNVAAANVVSTGSKTIVIVGERGTVSGKSGIVVDGKTTGIEAGKTVVPYVRFPGGEYTQGTARPKISAVGDFEWTRKTGKKAYVYFTSDDGKITSNRIIIAAS